VRLSVWTTGHQHSNSHSLQISSRQSQPRDIECRPRQCYSKCVEGLTALLPGLHSTHTEPPFGVIAVLTQYRCGALLNVSDDKRAASACQSCIIVDMAILPDAHSSAFASTAIAPVVGWVWRLAFGEPFTSGRDETYRRTGPTLSVVQIKMKTQRLFALC